MQSPPKRPSVTNEDQFRSELENNSLLLNPLLVDSQRNSSMRLQGPPTQNVSTITRMANQNHSTVF